MEHTHKAFRLIVVRYRHQAELLEEDSPRYHVIASNCTGSTADVLIWYRQRGEHSENGIKELKIGFGMERVPCSQESANAAFFRIGVMAYNLFVLSYLRLYARPCFLNKADQTWEKRLSRTSRGG